MQLKKSGQAPMGAAFFLFLGLAVIPVSLKAAGLNVSFSPRLSAAIDAWQQIAGVFGTSYQPVAESGFYALDELAKEPSAATDDPVSDTRDLACARELDGMFETLPSAVVATRVAKVDSVRRGCPKTASHAAGHVKRAEEVAATVVKSALEHAWELEVPASIKIEPGRERMLKMVERQILKSGFAPYDAFKSLTIPKNLNVLIRVKQAAAANAAGKGAECKVRSALGAARRQELDRARAASGPSYAPDNCDL